MNKYQKVLDNFWLAINCNAIPVDDVMKKDLASLQELVDKEIPKKPYYEGDGYADGVMVYDVARCPNCDNVFEEYENNGWGENYCNKCGQRLDWSDSK